MSSPHRSWPFSSISLVAFGVSLISIGIFFMALRPPLLAEDTRFVGLSLKQLQAEQPRLASWLVCVFQVLGGYAAPCGVLIVTVANTSFRRHDRIAGQGIVLAGGASIGWMVIVNFLIGADFRWVLMAIAMLWAGGMFLFFVERWSEDKGSVADAALNADRSGT